MKKWHIEPGKHFTNGFHWMPIHFGKRHLLQTIRFDENCYYKPTDWENDTNKGFGYTYGFTDDNNSIRWGWRPHKDRLSVIQVCIYIHENGEVKISNYIDVFTGRWITIDLLVVEGVSFLEIKRLGESIGAETLKTNIKPKWGYKNRPYFGGNLPTRFRRTIEVE